MPNPTHPDDDLHLGLRFDLNATDWATDTCLHTPAWVTQPKPDPPRNRISHPNRSPNLPTRPTTRRHSEPFCTATLNGKRRSESNSPTLPEVCDSKPSPSQKDLVVKKFRMDTVGRTRHADGARCRPASGRRGAGHWDERSEPMLTSQRNNCEIGGNAEAPRMAGFLRCIGGSPGWVGFAIDAALNLLRIDLPITSPIMCSRRRTACMARWCPPTGE